MHTLCHVTGNIPAMHAISCTCVTTVHSLLKITTSQIKQTFDISDSNGVHVCYHRYVCHHRPRNWLLISKLKRGRKDISRLAKISETGTAQKDFCLLTLHLKKESCVLFS